MMILSIFTILILLITIHLQDKEIKILRKTVEEDEKFLISVNRLLGINRW